MNQRIRYILKRPCAKDGRRTWQILQVTYREDGSTSYSAFSSPALDTLNKLWTTGSQDFAGLDKQAVDLRNRLNRTAKGLTEAVVFNEENLALLGDFKNPAPGTYWKEVYGRRKRIVDRLSSYSDLRRAIEAVKNLPLLTASEEELQKAIDSHGWPDNKQRRVIIRLEPLLKFIGRTDVKLERARPEYEEVRFLSEEEFGKVVVNVEGPLPPDGRSWGLQLLCKMAFVSGLRVGELFAVQPADVSDKTVNVAWQIDMTGKRRRTKTLGQRKAYLMKGGAEYFRQWFKIPQEDRLALRTVKVSSVVTRACRKAFPTQPNKWCVFHDLRHSYAVNLLQKGVPLSFVARSLGNSEVVCERHYTGKVLTDGFIEAIEAIVGKDQT